MRIVDEFEAGVGWQADEPDYLERCGHAVLAGGGVWIVDPLDVDGLDERLHALGEPAGVVQLLGRHQRDCAPIARRLGIPHHVVPFGGVDGAPFEAIAVADRPGWREIALWFPQEQTLACGDALGAASYFLAPGERLAVHPLLRPLPPRVLGRLDPRHVLCGHGPGVHGEQATAALHEALRTARSRLPSWLPAAAGAAWRRWRGR